MIASLDREIIERLDRGTTMAFIQKKSAIFGQIAGIGGFLLGALAMNALLNNREPSIEDADRRFGETRTGAVIKAEFRDDYDRALTELVAIAKDRSNKQKAAHRAAEVTAAIRRKYSPFAAQAPDTALRNVLQTQAALLKTVETKLGPKACAQFAILGPTSVLGTTGADKIEDDIDNAGAVTMKAMADGRRIPAKREAANNEDVAAFNAHLSDNGVSEAQLQLLGDATHDAADCTVSIQFLSIAATMSGESGERVRSYIVASITE